MQDGEIHNLLYSCSRRNRYWVKHEEFSQNLCIHQVYDISNIPELILACNIDWHYKATEFKSMLINQTAQCHVYTIDALFECTLIIRGSSFIGLNGLE